MRSHVKPVNMKIDNYNPLLECQKPHIIKEDKVFHQHDY